MATNKESTGGVHANNNTVIAEDVSQWEFDQFSGYSAWAHVAVDQSKQEGL